MCVIINATCENRDEAFIATCPTLKRKYEGHVIMNALIVLVALLQGSIH